jgi:hypothetical protein
MNHPLAATLKNRDDPSDDPVDGRVGVRGRVVVARLRATIPPWSSPWRTAPAVPTSPVSR